MRGIQWTVVGVVCAWMAGCGDSLAAPSAAEAPPVRAEEGGCACEGEVPAPKAVGMRIDEPYSDAWIAGERDEAEATTVLVFWEVWCPHCRAEMPHLVALDARPGVEVVGLTNLTRDATEAKVKAFVAEQGVTFAVGRDTGGLFEKVGAQGVPSAVVLKDGVVVWQGHPNAVPDDVL
ncbi:MAG: TlpA disulfide reductase family protein [Myxococcota bacterium]